MTILRFTGKYKIFLSQFYCSVKVKNKQLKYKLFYNIMVSKFILIQILLLYINMGFVLMFSVL